MPVENKKYSGKIARQMHLSKSTAYNIVHQKGYYHLPIENVKN